MSETRDSSPITEEVRFIEECPHCQSSLSDWMRKARGQHILRCEKRQLEMVESWPEEKQVTWYEARIRKLIPTARISSAMIGHWQIVDDQWNALSKAWQTARTAWQEAWSRLYSSEWAEYRQMIKEEKVNRFSENQIPTPAFEIVPGNPPPVLVSRQSVDELGIEVPMTTSGGEGTHSGPSTSTGVESEEKPKECPQCGNMNLGVHGDCVFCDDDPVVAHAVGDAAIDAVPAKPDSHAGTGAWDDYWNATWPEVTVISEDALNVPCFHKDSPERKILEQPIEGRGRHPEQIPMAGGKAASSKIPPFHLIPTVFLRRLAERCAVGIENKGDRAWNALSSNQEILSDKEFLIERLGHIIDHALKLRDKLAGPQPFVMGDDDAAAIAWGGMYAICATDVLEWIDTDEGGAE